MKFLRDSVRSPCTGVCQMTPDDGWCIGCLRTLDEIVDWSRKSADEKRAILARVEQREAERGSGPGSPEPRA